LNLQTDYPRQKNKSYKGTNKHFFIDEHKYSIIKKFCKDVGCTEYVFFLSVFGVLIHTLACSDRIIFGTPVSGRDQSQLTNVAGLFVNLVPIYSEISEYMKVIDYLQSIKYMVYGALVNHYFELDDYKRNETIGEGLFNVMVSYQVANYNIANNKVDFVEFVPIELNTSKNDLSFEVFENNKGFDIRCEFDSELFALETIDRYINYTFAIIDYFLYNKRRNNDTFNNCFLCDIRAYCRKAILCAY